MMGFVCKLASWRRGVGKASVVCILLAVVGVGVLPLCVSLRFASHLRAARQALEGHDLVAARTHLWLCRDLRPGAAEVQLLLARASRLGGFWADAEFRLNLCQQLGGASEAVALERTLLRVQQGRWSLALEEQLQSYIDQNHPELSAILDTLSEAYVKIYRLDSARYCLDLWLERQPNNLRALLRRGWVRERQHQFEEAAADYRQAVAAASSSSPPQGGGEEGDTARLRLAEVLLFLDRAEEARSLFESLRQQRPEDIEVLLGLARCFRKLGESQAAEQLLAELVRRAPRDSAVLLECGRLALQQNQLEQAENWLRQAAELAPYDYHTHYTLLLCLNQCGKRDEAEEQHQRVRRLEAAMIRMNELTDLLQTRPYDADLRCEIGRLFLANGEPREGVLWLKSALQVAPAHQATHQALAVYYEQNGRTDLAAPHRRFLQAPSAENYHDRLLSQPDLRP